MKRELILIETDKKLKLYEYIPSLFHPLYIYMSNTTLSRRVRLMLAYMQKNSYRVYYLSDDDVFVAYCVVEPGGRRLKCSTESDIVLGPYYVSDKYRGNGYSKILINKILNYRKSTYKNAYDYIYKTNIPSIRATESCGFKKCAELNIVGFFHKLVLCSKNGTHNVYKYNGNNDD